PALALVSRPSYRCNVNAPTSPTRRSYELLIAQTPSAMAVPATPTNPSPGTTSSPGTTQAGTSVTMSWSASSGATSYGIGVRDMVTSTLTGDANTSSRSYTASGLMTEHTYR